MVPVRGAEARGESKRCEKAERGERERTQSEKSRAREAAGGKVQQLTENVPFVSQRGGRDKKELHDVPERGRHANVVFKGRAGDSGAGSGESINTRGVSREGAFPHRLPTGGAQREAKIGRRTDEGDGGPDRGAGNDPIVNGGGPRSGRPAGRPYIFGI